MLLKGGRYNWKGQPEQLIYLGRLGLWHQFALVEDPDKVWCEVLTEDLDGFEESAPDEVPDTDSIRLLLKIRIEILELETKSLRAANDALHGVIRDITKALEEGNDDE